MTALAKPDPRNPVAIEVRYVPATGSKRPYEIWLSTANGQWYQRGSFKTRYAAEKSADKTRTLFGIAGASSMKIPRAAVSNIAMTTGGEKRHPTVIVAGHKMEWVGIGWIDEGEASPGDKATFPLVAD